MGSAIIPATAAKARGRPQDLSTLWTSHLRLSQSHLCPYCPDRQNFHQERRLFDHVHALHPELLPVRDDSDALAALRDDIRARARERERERDPGPLSPPNARRTRFPVRSSSPAALAAALEEPRPEDPTDPLLSSPTTAQRRLHRDIEPISLVHGPDRLSSEIPTDDAAADAQLSPLGPRKRAAAQDPGSVEIPPQSRPTGAHFPSHSRRSKARSATFNPAFGLPPEGIDPEFRRTATHAGHAPQAVPNHKKLFDPSNDDPLVRQGQMWPGVPSPVSQSQNYDSRAHGLRAKKDTRRRDTKAAGTGREKWRSATAKPPRLDEFNRNGPTLRTAVPNSGLMLQPDTRPISKEQLVEEVKGIYVGLVMVEAKCVEVVSKQVAAAAEMGKQPKLNNEQWQALIALHRTLLYEHHDFFLASQHPAASPTLRQLANRYAMPARMWRHGIHNFLELLRRRLPGSLDHMLAFIYLAYSMMSLLYETVPAFEDTWIECLGDLGRYRMAIEDDDIRDRDVWANVSRFWYSKAADKNPTVGRLYHHLAILARPNALEQLCYYCRSLTCVQPFLNARESILSLFDPFLKNKDSPFYKHHPVEKHFIKAHAILFAAIDYKGFEVDFKEYLGQLSKHIDCAGSKWKEQGVFIGIANIAALFEYGQTESLLRTAFEQNQMAMQDSAQVQEDVIADVYAMEPDPLASVARGVGQERQGALDPSQPQVQQKLKFENDLGLTQSSARSLEGLQHACSITFRTLSLVLQRTEDSNILEYLHVTLVFLRSLTKVQDALKLVEGLVPWDGIANYLNTLAPFGSITPRILDSQFPQPENPQEKPRPLKEDFAICGQVWSQDYYPDDWFSRVMIDDEERGLELPSMAEPRRERVLWLGVQIASYDRWLHLDMSSGKFSASGSVADTVGPPEPGPMELREYTPPTDEDEDDADDEQEGYEDVQMSGITQVENIVPPSLLSKPLGDDSNDEASEPDLNDKPSFWLEDGDGLLRELRLTSSPPGEK